MLLNEKQNKRTQHDATVLIVTNLKSLGSSESDNTIGPPHLEKLSGR